LSLDKGVSKDNMGFATSAGALLPYEDLLAGDNDYGRFTITSIMY
jgi:hypothetical protein